MAVTLTSVEKALKELYLGAIIDQLNTEVDPFTARIERSTEAIVGNNGIVRAAQVGLNGGFGAGTETGTLPTPGENIYKKLTSTTKNLYGVISVSDKALKSIRGNDKGSFANLIQREIDSMMTTAKWHFARQIYGGAAGTLATCTANATSSTTIGVNSVQFLMEGITIDIWPSSGTAIATARRIINVDRANKTITISGTGVVITSGAFITCQGSKDLEMTGLTDLFNTSATYLYGNTRATSGWLNPTVKTSVGAIGQDKLQDLITELEDAYNVKIDYISAGNDAFVSYMLLLKKESRQVNTMRLAGGVTGLKFNDIDVVRNKFAIPAGMDFLDTSKFRIDQVGEWDWIEGPTRSIFVQAGSTPTYNATLVKYADLMCLTPGGMGRMTGLSDPS